MPLFMIIIALVAIVIAVVPVTVILRGSAKDRKVEDEALQRWAAADPLHINRATGAGGAPAGAQRSDATASA